MIEQALKDFPKQFAWEAHVEGGNFLVKKNVIIGGMGGSQLAADILRMRYPDLPLLLHRNYGLPAMTIDTQQQSSFIGSSYSGNTEETLDAFETAHAAGLPCAVIATGGLLLKRAQETGVPYVALPDTGIQPRMALGFSLKALLALLGRAEGTQEAIGVASHLDPVAAETEGAQLGEMLRESIPVIYASSINYPLARIWKIKFNETGKIPAFANEFPELNHNEMTGFDWVESTHPLSQRFHFLFLVDPTDNPKIVRRMEVSRALYEARGFKTTMLPLAGDSVFEKVMRSAYCAEWTSYALARFYGAEPELVPLVEEFKKRMVKE